MNSSPFYACCLLLFLLCCGLTAADDWPQLPAEDGAVDLPAQEWPQKPGPRHVRVLIHYPQGNLAAVNEQTGLMLSLHNWGGEDCVGTANPQTLANRLNVVAICVNYLQSGRQASIEDPEPYDFGYLQSLDALRALWFVGHRLQQAERPYDDGRLYCTGGSGGGNVTQMAAKLAPRTFACVIDMCGMKKLSDDIAFNLPGGSKLNARWSRQAQSPNFLSVDAQEIRFVAHPQHLITRQRLGSRTKIIVVHGVDDHTCPIEDARELVANMQAAEVDVEPHFISQAELDGTVFTSTGHSLGNRTEIVLQVAGQYLTPGSEQLLRREGKSDFELKEEVRYATSTGEFVISYASGFPVGRFERGLAAVDYPEHQDLSYVLDAAGQRQEIHSAAQWAQRREHIVESLQRVMGQLPDASLRVPLDVRYGEEVRSTPFRQRKLSYQADPADRVPAFLLHPPKLAVGDKLPAILCLHQTTAAGKDEVVGASGPENMHYARELAEQGYVVLAPDYPSLGEHEYDFADHPDFVSGTMKAVWDNIRGVDLLQSLPYVDGKRIGAIGHSLGGHNAMFTAVFEPRIGVIVSSCGFSSLQKDDVPSWSGPRYMPRIATLFGNDANRLPFDFPEIVASLAPRPFLAVAAEHDQDFDASGVRDVMQAALPVYEMLDKSTNLQAMYPQSPHDFPSEARQRAFAFLAEHLEHRAMSESP